MPNPIKLSIVATLYHSAAYLPEFCSRSFAAARDAGFGDEIEIILVNDGSPDESHAKALELRAGDPRIKVVDLARNFGHHKAIMVGLTVANGDLVYLLDCDLEEEPEWLDEFLNVMVKEKADAVFGVQKKRKGGFWERISGSLFYTTARHIFGVDLPRNLITARLMTKDFVDAVTLHRDQDPMFAGLCLLTGFKQVAHKVKKHNSSPSSYTLLRKLRHVFTIMTSFSTRPLYLITLMGLFVTLVSAGWSIKIVLNAVINGVSVPGWSSTMISIWFVGGAVMFSIGICSLYIARIYKEMKPHPYVIIKGLQGIDQVHKVKCKLQGQPWMHSENETDQ